MKQLLSFLLCVVLIRAQAFAMTGGPNTDDGSGNSNIVGTYSGILIPRDDGGDTRSLSGGGSLAAMERSFSLGMPDTGYGTGTFVMFTQGIIFNGTITATGDPGKGNINGILEASFDYLDFAYDAAGNIVYQATVDAAGNVSITPVTQTYSAVVEGTMAADVTTNSVVNSSSAQSGNFGRISGDAQMGRIFTLGGGVNVTDTVQSYEVDGVKQSPQAATTGANANGGGGGGGGGGGIILLL